MMWLRNRKKPNLAFRARFCVFMSRIRGLRNPVYGFPASGHPEWRGGIVRIKRRTVLGAGIAMGGALAFPPLFAQSSGPVRMKLPDFAKDPKRLASLRKAVAVMKALPPSDHRSWFWWAATHAYNDALYRDALKRDPKLANVNSKRYWNQCPHFGQCSADFLIWHRAYLYYFERHLRDAAQDADLAVPYWDYSDPEQRTFPGAYAPATLSDGNANSLYHPSRNGAFTNGDSEISARVALAERAVSATTFFSDVGVTGFAGDFSDAGNPRQGLLEQSPHGDIHVVVGGVITGKNVNGAMSDIPKPPYEPGLWGHHANIDRMWAVWMATPGKQWGPQAPEIWLDEAPWIFKDIDGSDKGESRRFYMERANLPVRYDIDAAGAQSLRPPPPEVMAAAPTGGAHQEAAHREIPKREVETQIVANNSPIFVTPKSSVTRQLGQQAAPQHHPSETPDESAAPSAVGAAAPAPGAESVVVTGALNPAARVILELADIAFDRTPSSGFAVYLSAPGMPEAFAGMLDLFGATHAHVSGMSGMSVNQSFDVTSLVRQSDGPFTMRIAPYDLLVSKKGSPPARSDGVRVGSVRFVKVS
jgi:hypothetical protein